MCTSKHGFELPVLSRLLQLTEYRNQEIRQVTTTAFHRKAGMKNEDYLESQAVVMTLRVVNDTAERSVKLIRDYSLILTNYEDQKRYWLQVVNAHRNQFPDSNKNTLLANLNGGAVSAETTTQ